MPGKDDLQALIHSLSKREKQLFVMDAKRQNAKFLKLFQALDDAKAGDAEQWLKAHEGEDFQKNLLVRKSELLERILLVLRGQRQVGGMDKPIEFQARELLEDVRLLRDRKLSEHAFKRLAKAKKLAKKYELHELQIEILRMERFMVVDGQKAGYVEQVKQIHQELEEVRHAINQKLELLRLKDQLFLTIRQFAVLSGQVDMEMVEKVMEAPILKEFAMVNGFEARLNFLFCHVIYHQYRTEHKEMWEALRQIYQIWQAKPEMRKTRSIEYRNTLQNYLNISMTLHRFDDFDAVLRELKRGPFQNLEEEATTTFNALATEINRLMTQSRWPDVKLLEENYLAAKQKLRAFLQPTREALFSLLFARTHFIIGEYTAAWKWLQLMMAANAADVRQGIEFQGRMLEIMVLFELGDADELERRVKSNLLAFSKYLESVDLEIKLMQVLRKLVLLHNPKEVAKGLEGIHAEMCARADQDSDKNFVTFNWVKAKVAGEDLQRFLINKI